MANTIGGSDKEVVIRYLADTGQYEKEIRKLAKEDRKRLKLQKDIDHLNKRVSASSDRVAVSTSKYAKAQQSLAKSLTSSITKGNLYAAALRKVGNFLMQEAGNIDRYSNVLNSYTGNIEKARKATRGQVSDLELMAKRNEAVALGIKMGNDEWAELLGQLDQVSSAMGKDLVGAIDSAVTAMARSSAMRADNVGVIMSETEANEKYAESIGKTVSQLTELEKKQAFQAEFRKKLTKVTERSATVEATFSSALKSSWTEIKNYVHWGGMWLNRIFVPITTYRRRILQITRENTVALREERKAAIESWMAQGGLGGAEFGGRMTGAGAEQTARYPGALASIKAGLGHRQEFWPEEGPRALRPGQGYTPSRRAPRGKRRKRPQVEPTPPTWVSAPEAVSAVLDKTRSVEEVMAEIEQEKIQRKAEINRKSERNLELINAQHEAGQQHIATLREEAKAYVDYAEMVNFGFSAVANFTSGLWDAGEAALTSSKTFGQAMAEMLRATLMSVAKQATVLGMMALARYVNSWGIDVAALKSSGIYFATAAVAGGAGLAMSGAGIGVSSPRETARKQNRAGAGYSPQFGTRREQKQKISINLYLGDKGSPSAALMMTKQIEAQLGKAA
jgi:hypothetical protein